MCADRYPRSRNQRLPIEAYCDPERVVFLTVRATENSSPFARVREKSPAVFEVEFNEPLCHMVVDRLRETKETYACDVVVYCLMPDHLHLLARPRTREANVLIMEDRFKGKSTNQSWPLGWQGRLWQPRSFDHVLRDEGSIVEKAEYILNNPVRNRYVARWQDWPYCGRWDEII